MTTAWIVVAVLFVGTATMRAAGPVAFGGRSLSGRGAAVVGLVAPAILGALVVYETVNAAGGGVVLDARLLGLAAAALVLVRERCAARLHDGGGDGGGTQWFNLLDDCTSGLPSTRRAW